ncbi:ester cyclase [Klebsiella michiganensis]|uniref:Ester cyclase n=1 Tax=Klebsiella michiganensis TaxID=1134687 RepID=A0A6P1V754_9ENTR|nr:ester cyclase [Klebsiella michiganensis]QHS50275.1 ester cyclase [Klebsiella michiganensis]
MTNNSCGLIEPKEVIIDSTISESQLNAQLIATRKFDTFWATGDESLAREALSPDYRDKTLPPGRPLGVEGPIGACKLIHSAISDIKCDIDQLLVIGDRVVTYLNFTGSFTGSFYGSEGDGRTVNYISIDIYRFKDGLIIESWHIEDNLNLYKQLGIISF